MKRDGRIRLLVGIVMMGCVATSVSAINFQTQSNDHTRCDDEVITVVIPVALYDIYTTETGQEIVIEKFGRLPTPGEPCLPSRIFSIALPPGAEVVDIVYEAGTYVTLPGTYTIAPVSLPQITSQEHSSASIYTKNRARFDHTYNLSYRTNAWYPKNVVEFVRVSGYRHYSLVDVRVTPVMYHPLLAQLRYYPEIKFEVRYHRHEPHQATLVNTTRTIEHRAQELISNYNQTHQWYPKNTIGTNGTHDFVIITLDALESAVTSLVEWETTKGRTVQVVTTTWIDTHYQGYDLAEKIRKFLREKYPGDAWGIEDVLIVGHRDDIPMRQVEQVIDSGQNKPETDYYYAELSLSDADSWDRDGDHRYGENSDTIDFYAEITAGRIPWSDYATVAHICEKSVAFEQTTDPSFKNNMLLLAAGIDQRTDGAAFMEYCVDTELHPWMTQWMKTRLYEHSSTYPFDYVLTHTNVVSVWSSGTFAVVSWNAHGNPFGSGNFISVDDCSALNDAYPAIISAASCSNSDTDYVNIGQAMMRQGAVGFLGANKAAYYAPGWTQPADGSDQSFKYFFTTGVTSGEYTQGQAHQYALQEMYTKGLWNQLYYETFIHGSLWGNPDLGIASYDENTAPTTPMRPHGVSSGKPGIDYTFTSVSTDRDNDHLYYCWSWGDGATHWSGPVSSNISVNESHTWRNQGSFEVKVKAKDLSGAESAWSDPCTVTIQKSKPVLNRVLLQILESLIERVPVHARLLTR